MNEESIIIKVYRNNEEILVYKSTLICGGSSVSNDIDAIDNAAKILSEYVKSKRKDKDGEQLIIG